MADLPRVRIWGLHPQVSLQNSLKIGTNFLPLTFLGRLFQLLEALKQKLLCQLTARSYSKKLARALNVITRALRPDFGWTEKVQGYEK